MPTNAVHWHLILNHVPIMAVVFGIPALLYGSWRRQEAVTRVALVLFVVAGAAVVPAYRTGSSAEEIAEELRAVNHADIERHAEAAELTYYLTLGLGIYGLAGLVYYRGRESTSWGYLIGASVLGVVTLTSLAHTATEGARIRHPEIDMTVPSEDAHPDHENGETRHPD